MRPEVEEAIRLIERHTSLFLIGMMVMICIIITIIKVDVKVYHEDEIMNNENIEKREKNNEKMF